MKRKPTTKQTVTAALAKLLSRNLREAREATSQYAAGEAGSSARGAILLAYCSDVIDGATYDALCDLAINATYERQIELAYDQPPYTGSAFAETKRYPKAASVTSAAAGGDA